MPATFGYWKLRGLAHYIRFLLEYTGEEYTEKLYDIGPAPDYDKSQWLDEKFKLGLDFPNLPYYIDGDIKLTQSSAILRHIARKHNLLAKSEAEIAKSDMLECEAMDLRMNFIRLTYGSDFESQKDDFIVNTMQPKLSQLSKFLGSNDWFLGNKISYVDFFLYEAIYCFKRLSPSSVDQFDNLKQFLNRFESLEAIKKYINSNRYIENPINGPMAFFGGK